MNDAALTEVFMNESKEIISNLEPDIVTLEENRKDQEIINRIFRYFHTLKGSSGIAGFDEDGAAVPDGDLVESLDAAQRDRPAGRGCPPGG